MANEIPIGTAGQMMKKGAVDWEAMDVDSDPFTIASLEIDPTNGLQAGGGSINDEKIGVITAAGKISGAALTGLANIPSGAGQIPAANITSAPLTGGVFTTSGIHSGLAPTSWTDINLGFPLDYRVSLLVFAVFASSITPSGAVWFRTKGDTGIVTDPGVDTELGGGISSFYLRDGEGAYVAIQTNSAGVIQWQVENASMQVAIELRAVIYLDN